MSNPSNPAPAPTAVGGLFVTWLLGDDVRTIRTKAGEQRTLVELGDPARLSHSLVIRLDGEAGDLASLRPGASVTLRLEAVRSGRARGELVANVPREAVEAAFARARDAR